jgi:DNA primase
MSLFPPSFIEDLKMQTDILSVINEVTPLRKAGASWKGLCPFHQEKTPSFNVNPDKGMFKCFGCGVGGDVFKFIELHNKMPFPEAVRLLATRASIAVPEADGGPEDRAAAAEREGLVKLQERAEAFFIEQLALPAGARARRELEQRGLSAETIAAFHYGYAPGGGRDTLSKLFAADRIPLALQKKSGLVYETDDGRIIDRFRNRLMIPIARDTGQVVAFGGRALEEGQVKYINSPETPIYSKGRTLYGLNVTKGAVRAHNYCVLVEGYFDFAQVWQAGIQPVVAISGTALTITQVKLLKRLTSKVVLSLDPDAAGQSAAARSSELLVSEGFHVNVALLPKGADPDAFIRSQGAKAYVERLKGSVTYLKFLLDRAATGQDLNQPDIRKTFLDAMLSVAATIPDAATRDQFADDLAVRAGVTESVVRDEIRRTAAQRKTKAPALAVRTDAQVWVAEQGLLWTLIHRPVEGLAALGRVDLTDFDGIVTGPILRIAVGLVDVPPDVLPELLRERLTEAERALLDRASAAAAPAAPAAECVNTLRRERLERDLARVQQEINERQRSAALDDDTLMVLWERKKELRRQLDELT